MGYMENSYSNSNNGGSVNSQDSLWQLKMGGNASNQMIPSHNYGYDPLTHGYGGVVDDYATYPHLTTNPAQHIVPDDYHHNMMNSQNPYAAVHKPKKHLDQHLGTWKKHKTSKNQYFNINYLLITDYHDVSGLPDPYMEHINNVDQVDHQKPPQSQHMSLGYDETLESGYSTPNSRNRRVIREIIVWDSSKARLSGTCL